MKRPSAIVVLLVGLLSACGEEANHGAGGSLERPDLILVTIDTIRGDAIGFAGGTRAKTPFIDRLANEGTGFLNAHAHSTVTLPSHANILTGLLPWQHGVRDNANFRLDEEVPTLAGTLRNAGYSTGAVIGAFPLDRRFGLNSGFDHYDDILTGTAPGEFNMAELSADQVLEKGVAWWKQNQQSPRFLWVHLYDPHFPYAPPGSNGNCGEPCYYDEITYVDSALQRWLEPILSADAPLVIVTGDHGEALGDHGEMTHGVFAYEEVLKVPLVVWDGGDQGRGITEDYVRHIDIAPTILERAGLEPEERMEGESLFSVSGDRDTYFESLNAWYTKGWAPLIGLIHQKHKYIDLPIPELYDLVEDPGELENIFGEKRRLMFGMREILAASAPAEIQDPNREVSDEEAKTLLSLGYVTGAAGDEEITEADDPKNLIQYDTMLHEGLALYEAGDVGAAIAKIRRLTELQPKMEVAHNTLAVLLQLDNRPKDAMAALAEAWERGDDSPKLAKRYGMLLSEAGRHPEAMEVLEPYSDSVDPELRNALGVVLRNLGRTPEAIGHFNAALELDETNAEAYQNLGIAALDSGALREARSHLERAVELDSALPSAWNALGVVQMRSGDPRAAMASWQKAVELDPLELDAWLNLGRVAGGLGEIDVSRRALEEFLERAPQDRYAREIQQVKAALRELGNRASAGG